MKENNPRKAGGQKPSNLQTAISQAGTMQVLIILAGSAWQGNQLHGITQKAWKAGILNASKVKDLEAFRAFLQKHVK